MKTRYMRVKSLPHIAEDKQGKVGVFHEEANEKVHLIFGHFYKYVDAFSAADIEEWQIPEISIGNQEGIFFSKRREENLVDVARQIAPHQPTISNIKVWYCNQEDYQHLEFDLKGHHYDIRAYKIYCIAKDGRSNFLLEKLVGYSDCKVVQFFVNNHQEEWDVTKGIYDLYQGRHMVKTLFCKNLEEAKEQAKLLEIELQKHRLTITCSLEPM